MNKYALGACTFEFKPLGGTALETVTITHTEQEAETTLSTETTLFEIFADQALGPVYSRLSNLTATLTTSIFFEPEIVSQLTAEWRKGSSGFGLGNIGEEQPVFELTIKPKGTTTPEDWMVMPFCRVKSDLNIGLKREGKALINLTVNASSDERTDNETFGLLLTTGNFTRTVGK
ncbi:MAG: hypothetical protein ACRC6E_10985 [Fusobacteriaceae bacterium]